VTFDEARLLKELVRGKTVLEIGTGVGVSARIMSEAARAVATVDVDLWVVEWVWPVLTEEAPLRNVLLHRAVPDPGVPFDAAFIDGHHTEEAAFADIVRCSQLVRGGGLLVLHDIWIEDVARAATESGLRWVELGTGLGLAVANVPRS